MKTIAGYEFDTHMGRTTVFRPIPGGRLCVATINKIYDPGSRRLRYTVKICGREGSEIITGLPSAKKWVIAELACAL